MKPIVTRIRTGALWLTLAALPTAVLAHHSYAMFDMSQTVTLQGTIRDFQWTNPHSWIWVDVPGASGATEQWGIEGMSPNYLARRGWTKSTMKPGEKVTISVRPLRNGQNGGMFVRATLADGRVLTQTGQPKD